MCSVTFYEKSPLNMTRILDMAQDLQVRPTHRPCQFGAKSDDVQCGMVGAIG